MQIFFDGGAGFYYRNNGGMARGLFLDDEWELIEEEPKQGDEIKFGDMVYVRYKGDENFLEIPRTYLGFKDGYHWAVDSGHTLENGRGITPWDEVKKAPTKIELTIEEIEEKLGYEKGSLSIK